MKAYTYIAQLNDSAYGVDNYGTQEYSCANGAECVNTNQTPTTPTTTTTVEAPNTGFLGTGIPDAAVSTTAAALVVAVSLASIIFIVVRMIKRHKKASR